MSAHIWSWTVLLSLLPISELRGAIPYAISQGIPFYIAWPVCVALNALVAPLVYLFLATFHKIFYKWTFYARLFDKIIENARHKLHDKVEKYGYLGVTLFVAIPLPITGAYTGTLGAWILGLSRKKNDYFCTDRSDYFRNHCHKYHGFWSWCLFIIYKRSTLKTEPTDFKDFLK